MLRCNELGVPHVLMRTGTFCFLEVEMMSYILKTVGNTDQNLESSPLSEKRPERSRQEPITLRQ